MLKLSLTWGYRTAFPAVVICLALFFTSGIVSVEAQETATKPKAAAKGETGAAGASVKIGDKIPAINLKDQSGKSFDLNAALKDGPVALVIFRSADW